MFQIRVEQPPSRGRNEEDGEEEGEAWRLRNIRKPQNDDPRLEKTRRKKYEEEEITTILSDMLQ
jgi:hypothetical protein